MIRPDAAALRVRAQIMLWRHGAAWPLVLLLASGAAAAGLLLLAPSVAEREAAQRALAREQQTGRAAASGQGAISPEMRARDALAAVLRNSPDPATLVRKMDAFAEAEQVRIAQADYAQQAIGDGITRLQVTQPVRAGYLQLRDYVGAVLAALPNASLDRMLFRRETVSQGQVEARLHWSLWLRRDGASSIAPARKSPSPPEALETLTDRAQLFASAAGADGVRRDLFAARDWNPPPTPAPAASAPPSAPPLPFAFMGKKFESGAWEVYLAAGAEAVIAREHEVLAGTYRVDQIAPPSMNFTYLPLAQVQTLQIGSAP